MLGHPGLAIPFFIFLLFVSTPVFGQRALPDIHVTIPERVSTINQILDEITLQTGYYFTYNAALISGKQKVRFRVVDLPLVDALDSLLQNPRFDYRVIDQNIVGAGGRASEVSHRPWRLFRVPAEEFCSVGNLAQTFCQGFSFFPGYDGCKILFALRH